MHSFSSRPAHAPPPGSHSPVDDDPLDPLDDDPLDPLDDESDPLLPSDPMKVVDPDVVPPVESEPPVPDPVPGAVLVPGGPDVEVGSGLVVDESPSSVAVASSPHPPKTKTTAMHRARPMQGCCPPGARSVYALSMLRRTYWRMPPWR